MSFPRPLVPIAVALVGLAGSLAATFSLYHSASAALDRVLDQRLEAAGKTAADLLGPKPTSARLRAVEAANALDGAYVIDPGFRMSANAEGPSGGRVDLLRVDLPRLKAAFAGTASAGGGYDFGALHVATAYFPLRSKDGKVSAVLALEAGKSFIAGRERLRHALWGGVALCALGALALALVAARWSSAEKRARTAVAEAARGEAISRMAATAAHEIRNPLGVIRGTVELMRERAGASLGERDRAAMQDVLDEVERLRKLTEDFLDLSADRPLALKPLALDAVLREAAAKASARFPELDSAIEVPASLEVVADEARLHQVLANLLTNSAQAGARRVELSAATVEATSAEVFVRISDDGAGISSSARARLFEPFVTGKAGGTGIGLALSRRLMERSGGGLRALETPGPGATFELRLRAARGNLG